MENKSSGFVCWKCSVKVENTEQAVKSIHNERRSKIKAYAAVTNTF